MVTSQTFSKDSNSALRLTSAKQVQLVRLESEIHLGIVNVNIQIHKQYSHPDSSKLDKYSHILYNQASPFPQTCRFSRNQRRLEIPTLRSEFAAGHGKTVPHRVLQLMVEVHYLEVILICLLKMNLQR